MTMQRDEVFRSKFLRLPETNSETLVRPRPASVGCSPNQEIKISRSRAFAVCIRSIGKAAKLAVEESEYGGLGSAASRSWWCRRGWPPRLHDR